MIKVNSKKVKVENVEFHTNDECKEFSGTVTITPKTKDLLARLLDLADRGMVDDWDRINFTRVQEVHCEVLQACRKDACSGKIGFNVDNLRNENGGWRSSNFICTESGVNKRNNFDGRQMGLLKKLGIIEFVNPGNCDNSTARIVFQENALKQVMLFEDVKSTKDLENEENDILDEFKVTVSQFATRLASSGSKMSIDDAFQGLSGVADEMFENAREDARKMEARQKEIKALKAKIKSLQA